MRKVANHLLLKDDVGRPKPSTRDLPYQDFTYGRAEIRDPEGASEGTFSSDHNVFLSCHELEIPQPQQPERYR